MMAGPLSGKHVLIVEDQYLIADEMQRAVTALGGEAVGPCSGVETARGQIAAETVDLALLDINLGGEDVFPLADDLLEKNIPIIFATGYDDWMIPPRFQHCRRIQKPVSYVALEALVQQQPPHSL